MDYTINIIDIVKQDILALKKPSVSTIVFALLLADRGNLPTLYLIPCKKCSKLIFSNMQVFAIKNKMIQNINDN